jgi:hypothetical protein
MLNYQRVPWPLPSDSASFPYQVGWILVVPRRRELPNVHLETWRDETCPLVSPFPDCPWPGKVCALRMVEADAKKHHFSEEWSDRIVSKISLWGRDMRAETAQSSSIVKFHTQIRMNITMDIVILSLTHHNFITLRNWLEIILEGAQLLSSCNGQAGVCTHRT